MITARLINALKYSNLWYSTTKKHTILLASPLVNELLVESGEWREYIRKHAHHKHNVRKIGEK